MGEIDDMVYDYEYEDQYDLDPKEEDVAFRRAWNAQVEALHKADQRRQQPPQQPVLFQRWGKKQKS